MVMEDASKTWPYLKPGIGKKAENSPEEIPGANAQETPRPEEPTTGQKTLDRWFIEERGGKRVPKRLQIPNEAL
ncbi:MAG: hypothetical protein GWN87_28835, partial [Desulfuromonadales bacterium]|nr:hypothetical protein [Desulfuromonadales bacterium]